MSRFSTAISAVTPGATIIRGYPHAELIERSPYVANAFLTLVGRFPTSSEASVLEAMLSSVIDHGFVSVTTSTGRYAASGNPNLVAAVAAGLLAAGDNTLSPAASYDLLASLAAMIQASPSPKEAIASVVKDYLTSGRRIPGLGHPTHRETDYRADAVFRVARRTNVAGVHTDLLHEVLAAFHEISGKSQVPINIDGCLAALSLDMGLTRDQAVGISLLGVLPGLISHVAEQIQAGDPLHFIEDGDYVGPSRRPFDQLGTDADGVS
jgi:citrate synthase